MPFIDLLAQYTEIQNLNLNGLQCSRKVEWIGYSLLNILILASHQEWRFLSDDVSLTAWAEHP